MQVGSVAKVRSEINVTPLVDVVLVLLIIFMVVTPMLQKGPAVKLPVTDNPPKKPDDKSQILVALQADKVIWIEKERIDASSFGGKIREAFQRNPGSSVVIKGDARVTYGDVKKLMLEVKEAGFNEVGLIAQRREGQGGD